ncbi:MAG: DUF2634 domain-containing protein [Velocimicrobium sp.]
MIQSVLLDEAFEIQDELESTKTYQLFDFKIQGYIEGMQALKQSIYKILSTQQYEYPIYSFDYGINLESLIGKEAAYVKVELKRRIKECLLQDKRVQDVTDFVFDVGEDTICATFKVVSMYGEITITQEVSN